MRELRSRIAEGLAEGWPAIVLGICFLAVWEAFCRGLGLPQNLFPAPSFVIWSLITRADLLLANGWLTFYQTVLGFTLSVIGGVGIGWAISKSRVLFEAFYPIIVVLQVMPKEALAPLLVLWFGAGSLSRMILAFLIAFFPMVINAALGVRSLNPNLRSYATSLACSRWQFFIKVDLPSALPSIFAGMKIAVTLSVIGIVVAEIVAGRDGLGYLLLFASSRLDMGFALAILLVLAFWGGLLYTAIAWLESKVIFWRHG